MKKEVKEQTQFDPTAANVMAQSIIESDFNIGMIFVPKARSAAVGANRVEIKTSQLGESAETSFEVLPTKTFIQELIQLLYKHRAETKAIRELERTLSEDYKEGTLTNTKAYNTASATLVNKMDAIHKDINKNVL